MPEHGTTGAAKTGARNGTLAATEVTRAGEAILLSFDTAWSPPVPIFTEVARRFPTLRIKGDFIEEFLPFRRQRSLQKRHCRVGG